ncbi:MAG: hypothetical protein QM501_05705, partial [Gimesia sp.]
ASLRQEILDELSDHFACALSRELLKNPNEQTAKQRVLKQFGDPVKIARQLWLDAMKEKIMSQRIMTGISVAMAACGFIVVGLVWTIMNQSERVNLKMLEQLAILADRPQPVATANVDQKILNQLEQLNQKQTALGGSASEAMNQISFQLVQGNKDKKPAVGFTGKLTKSGTQTDSFELELVSNEAGMLEFGKLPWGKYYLYLYAPWGEVGHQSDVTIIPGRNYTQTIVCPASAPEDVSVQFQADWPNKLKSEDWYLLCDFRQSQSAGGDIFRYSFDSTRKAGDGQWITYQNQFLKPRGVYLVDSDNRVSLCPLSQDGKFEEIKLDSLLEKPSINMIQGEYSLPVIYLIQKEDLKQISLLNSSKTYSVINKNKDGTFSYNPMNSLQRAGSFGFGGGSYFGGSDLSKVPTTVILMPFNKEVSSLAPVTLVDHFFHSKDVDGMSLPRELNFTAGKDQANVWEIKLGDLERIKLPENVKTR